MSMSQEKYPVLPCHVMDYLKSIDKQGTILVVSDCDKWNYDHWNVFSDLIKFLLAETHSMTVRVGGNSYRLAESMIGYLLKHNATDVKRFEFYLGPLESFPERYLKRARASMTVRFVNDFAFDVTSDFMRYVGQYDIRKLGANMPYKNPGKDAWAIADVMMVKGYGEILPATHVLYSDTWSDLMPNERQLFKDAGIVCHHLLRPYESD